MKHIFSVPQSQVRLFKVKTRGQISHFGYFTMYSLVIYIFLDVIHQSTVEEPINAKTCLLMFNSGWFLYFKRVTNPFTFLKQK